MGKIKNHKILNIKRKIIAKFNNTCIYCGTKCVFWSFKPYETIPDKTATIEHLYPKSDIRRLLAGNKQQYLRLACYRCNTDKGQRDGAAFSDDNYVLDDNLLSDIFNGEYEKISIEK